MINTINNPSTFCLPSVERADKWCKGDLAVSNVVEYCLIISYDIDYNKDIITLMSSFHLIINFLIYFKLE